MYCNSTPAFYDLVQPLIEKCPRAMGVADNRGRTPRQLIKKIKKLLSEKGAKVRIYSPGNLLKWVLYSRTF